ncbi:Alpha-latrotoxin-Lhe1a, partial [Diplonema papillatum]
MDDQTGNSCEWLGSQSGSSRSLLGPPRKQSNDSSASAAMRQSGDALATPASALLSSVDEVAADVSLQAARFTSRSSLVSSRAGSPGLRAARSPTLPDPAAAVAFPAAVATQEDLFVAHARGLDIDAAAQLLLSWSAAVDKPLATGRSLAAAIEAAGALFSRRAAHKAGAAGPVALGMVGRGSVGRKGATAEPDPQRASAGTGPPTIDKGALSPVQMDNTEPDRRASAAAALSCDKGPLSPLQVNTERARLSFDTGALSPVQMDNTEPDRRASAAAALSCGSPLQVSTERTRFSFDKGALSPVQMDNTEPDRRASAAAALSCDKGPLSPLQVSTERARLSFDTGALSPVQMDSIERARHSVDESARSPGTQMDSTERGRGASVTAVLSFDTGALSPVQMDSIERVRHSVDESARSPGTQMDSTERGRGASVTTALSFDNDALSPVLMGTDSRASGATAAAALSPTGERTRSPAERGDPGRLPPPCLPPHLQLKGDGCTPRSPSPPAAEFPLGSSARSPGPRPFPASCGGPGGCGHVPACGGWGSDDWTEAVGREPAARQQRPRQSSLAKAHKLVRQLLRYGNADFSANVQRPAPVAAAVATGDAKLVEIVLGGPLTDLNRDFPLARAVTKGNSSVLQVLLSSAKVNPNKGDPLCRAVEAGRLDAVRALLRHRRISVNKLSSGTGSTPLCQAIQLGERDIVDHLLMHPRIDLNKGFLLTPLQHAVSIGDELLIKKLLTAGGARPIDPNRSLGGVGTPLYIAAANGVASPRTTQAIVRLLISHPRTVIGSRFLDYLDAEDRVDLQGVVLATGRGLPFTPCWKRRAATVAAVYSYLVATCAATLAAAGSLLVAARAGQAAALLALVAAGNAVSWAWLYRTRPRRPPPIHPGASGSSSSGRQPAPRQAQQPTHSGASAAPAAVRFSGVQDHGFERYPGWGGGGGGLREGPAGGGGGGGGGEDGGKDPVALWLRWLPVVYDVALLMAFLSAVGVCRVDPGARLQAYRAAAANARCLAAFSCLPQALLTAAYLLYFPPPDPEKNQ